MAPVRLLRIAAVLRWHSVPVYEQISSQDFVEMPYSETQDTDWDRVCAVSWRWSKAKPSEYLADFSPMSASQLEELSQSLSWALESGMQYVWIDWSCCPQVYSADSRG
jgi:hypothetical protein